MAEGASQWAIWTEGLTKQFGRLKVLDGIDLRVARGRVYGFVGPNGSGKTTAIGILLGLMRPSAGRAMVLGEPLGSPGYYRALARVGSLVQAPAFYPDLSGRDNLRVLGAVGGDVTERAIDRALERVGLLKRARDRYSTYSLGMRQRLAIALALLHDPELVILDEPTNGLDPPGILEVRALIRELAREGRTVLFSSHLLHEVEQVCDDVGILVQGRLVVQGPVHQLVKPRGLRVRVAPPDAQDQHLPAGSAGAELAAAQERNGKGSDGGQLRWLCGRAAAIVAALPGRPRVEVLGEDAIWVDLPERRAAEVTQALAAAGIWVCELAPVRRTLEEYFSQVASAGEPEGLDGQGWVPDGLPGCRDSRGALVGAGHPWPASPSGRGAASP